MSARPQGPESAFPLRAPLVRRGVSYDDGRPWAERWRVHRCGESSDAPKVAHVLALVRVAALRRILLEPHDGGVRLRQLVPELRVVGAELGDFLASVRPELSDHASESSHDPAGRGQPPRRQIPHSKPYGGGRLSRCGGSVGEGAVNPFGAFLGGERFDKRQLWAHPLMTRRCAVASSLGRLCRPLPRLLSLSPSTHG